MKAAYSILATSLFGALAAAAPVNVVWITETDIDYVTTTETVYGGGHQAEATSTSSSTTSEASAYSAWATSTPVTIATTSISSSVDIAPSTKSAYVASSTSSTSVYVAPTSSSVYTAPTSSSTSVYVAPTTSETPSSTYIASSTTSSAASATSSSASSGSGIAAAGTKYTGDLTWYETGEGACGWDNTASDHIVAISEIIFDAAEYITANPNNNPLCGRYVSITGKDGSQYQAKVVDRCTGCALSDLDLSEDFFNTVTDNGNGRVSDMGWTWM